MRARDVTFASNSAIERTAAGSRFRSKLTGAWGSAKTGVELVPGGSGLRGTMWLPDGLGVAGAGCCTGPNSWLNFSLKVRMSWRRPSLRAPRHSLSAVGNLSRGHGTTSV